MRHEHVAQAVLPAGTESTDGVGQVGEPAGAGLELNQLGVHDRNYATPSVTAQTAVPSTST